ncbi:Eight transmembrane protein EpsH [Altererythrobacter epoxidivorans]|uniref:Eight transmembrane protein EpsH n=1 Tax=Altererythrobacter epoxidivorans TaxID=361183 RepID=A0A0M4M7V1_9SPHN|nr:exosortase A [Altererythrobacter epoxidivorans]ALE16585.1 Eight transmembrane protein EpsH [Altererythrobacter epoxidivorans]
MQHERSLNDWRENGALTGLAPAWRSAIGHLALAWLALIVLAAREWGEMLHQWWNIDTYNHILLLPPLIGWLVALRRHDLAKLQPQPSAIGFGLLVAALTLWLSGRMTGVNLLAHAGAVGAIMSAVVLALGIRIGALLALPLGMMVFLVPFGDEIIPPLQMITARIAIELTHLSGVPATVDGIYIDTPVGLFIVAEACSGVKFLIAMVTLGILVCFTAFEKWSKRALFMAACVVVPIIANGIRAWGTIFIAQSQGVEFAAGFDHIFYGWIFFAIVLALVLGATWRFFERNPEDAGFALSEIDSNPVLSKLSRYDLGGKTAVIGFLAIIVLAFAASIYAAPTVL